MPFEGFDFTGFWDESAFAKKFDCGPRSEEHTSELQSR